MIVLQQAGEGEDGRLKSAIGIGSLLMDGLGDTIRVSLTEDPEYELEPCRSLSLCSQPARNESDLTYAALMLETVQVLILVIVTSCYDMAIATIARHHHW